MDNTLETLLDKKGRFDIWSRQLLDQELHIQMLKDYVSGKMAELTTPKGHGHYG